jgi:pimeloyl-ACP methyl ester carboxylesterase
MLLQGKYDKMAAPMPLAQKLQKLIPHAKLYLVENAGHFPPNEQPDEVKTYLDEFLKAIFS